MFSKKNLAKSDLQGKFVVVCIESSFAITTDYRTQNNTYQMIKVCIFSTRNLKLIA